MPAHHLKPSERDVIAQMFAAGASRAAIARSLGRHRGTISRELLRNGTFGVVGKRPSGRIWRGRLRYGSIAAQMRARLRRRAARLVIVGKLNREKRLARYVRRRLLQQWSPEQISGRIRREYLKDHGMRISHETIYQWIRSDKSQGGSLFKQLRQSRKKRRKKYGSSLKRLQIPDRVSINKRPKVVDRRSRLGDWEGDTMEGQKKSGYLLTQVERKSGYLVSVCIDRQDVRSVNRAAIRSLKCFPSKLLRTMTLDNGSEFYGYQRIEQSTGVRVYFADPYSSWQRGTNENTNGLLRQYFPKGTDFLEIRPPQLAGIVRRINNRPRKRHGYRTPSKVLLKAN